VGANHSAKAAGEGVSRARRSGCGRRARREENERKARHTSNRLKANKWLELRIRKRVVLCMCGQNGAEVFLPGFGGVSVQ